MRNFTQSAQLALVIARRRSSEKNHKYVGPEHLLLGLLELPPSTTSCKTMKLMGVTNTSIQEKLDRALVPTPQEESCLGNIPFTPRFKKVLVLASKIGRELNDHELVTSGHILIGILSEGESEAAITLHELGFDVDTVKEYVKSVSTGSKEI